MRLARHSVTTSRTLDGRQYVLHYDHLVLALGSADDLSRYPGMAEHALKLKTWADCFQVRNHLLAMLELAEIEDDPVERRRLLTFVVAGGNYAGVEVATELVDYFHLLSRKEYRRIDPREVRVVLVHSGENLLPELRQHYPKLANWAQRHIDGLRQDGLELRLGTRLAAATPDEAVLSSGERIATRTIISCTGTAQSPLLDQLPFARDERGRVITDETIQVPGTTNVWAAGDCAAVPHPRGGTCPPLGIYALTCGWQIARNILRVVDGKRPTRYWFDGLGDAVSLGRRKAVAQVRGFHIYGFPAWLTWRAFLLFFIPTWDRKVRLILDWLAWPFIGRDIVNMQAGGNRTVGQALFEAGQTVVRQGDIGKQMYVIRQGEAEVLRTDPSGKEEVIARIGPGDHFGEMAVFQNVRRTATVRALTRLQLLVLGRDDVITLSETVRPFADEMAHLPHHGDMPPPAFLTAAHELHEEDRSPVA